MKSALLISPFVLAAMAKTKQTGTKMEADLEGMEYTGSDQVFK
jgi:hypothetical protein